MSFKPVKAFMQNYESFEFTEECYINLSKVVKIETFKEYPHHFRVFFENNKECTYVSEDLTILLKGVKCEF